MNIANQAGVMGCTILRSVSGNRRSEFANENQVISDVLRDPYHGREGQTFPFIGIQQVSRPLSKRIRIHRRIVFHRAIWFAAIVMGSGGCNSSEQDAQPDRCVPGHVSVCPCGNGVEGVQKCNAVGTYDECTCGLSPPSPDTAALMDSELGTIPDVVTDGFDAPQNTDIIGTDVENHMDVADGGSVREPDGGFADVELADVVPWNFPDVDWPDPDGDDTINNVPGTLWIGLELLLTIGKPAPGDDPGQFYGPGGLDIDSAGNVYVLDMGNNRVQKFNTNGKFLKAWPHVTYDSKSDLGNFTGLAIDSKDRIYTLSPKIHMVRVYDTDGNELLKWELKKHSGWPPAIYHGHDICVTATGVVLVSEPVLGSVQAYSTTGKYLWAIEFPVSQGQKQSPPSQPWSYRPFAIGSSPTGDLFVADVMWLRRFSATGEFLSTVWNPALPLPTVPPPPFGAFWQAWWGIDFDKSGNLYITEALGGDTGRISVFTPNGEVLVSWGSLISPAYGTGKLPPADEFFFLNDVAVDNEGNIWVTDGWGNFVRKYRPIKNDAEQTP